MCLTSSTEKIWFQTEGKCYGQGCQTGGIWDRSPLATGGDNRHRSPLPEEGMVDLLYPHFWIIYKIFLCNRKNANLLRNKKKKFISLLLIILYIQNLMLNSSIYLFITFLK